MIRVEAGPDVKETRCDSCGGTNRVLHGLVYEDEYAHGVYFVEWCDGEHAGREAFMTVGLGRFGAGSDPSGRSAFGIEWRQNGMTLTDAPVRDRPNLLGQFVPRSEALDMPNVDHLWHVADHIVLDDPRVAEVQKWLEGE